MFRDELKITVIAGKGGDGAATFRREKFIARGGPDGGDGGVGGSIIFKVNSHLNTLSPLASKKLYKAEKGTNGQRKNMHGAGAENLILEVPPGTLIYTEDKSQLLADLTDKDQIYTAAKGGKGGLGNARFVSSTNQAPKFAERGEPGEEITLFLELSLVAEVGIIGLPSAGKSTLISVISNAKPKIAAYHFTTLIPNLGIVDMPRFGGNTNQNFVIADIPGLIEGASEGRGLGHKFLKHTARTNLLIHVLAADSEDPIKDYKIINQELKKYDKNLSKTPQIITLNKIDLLTESELKTLTKKLQKLGEIFPISGLTRTGLKELLFKAHEKLQEIRKQQAQESARVKEIAEQQIPILTPHLEKETFKIDKIIKKEEHKIFRITGKRIEQLIHMTDTSNPEGLERIYHYLDRLGIQKAIEKKGATFGDKIKILETYIPYRPIS